MTKEEMLELRSMMEDVVAPIKEDIKTLKEDVSILKQDVGILKERVSGLEVKVGNLEVKVGNLEVEVGTLKGDVASLKSEMAEVKDRLTRVELTQENIIIPQIQLLAEGHQNILDHIDSKIEAMTDGLRGRVDVLEVVVRQHSKDIAELKRA